MTNFAKLKENAVARQQQKFNPSTGMFEAGKKKLTKAELGISVVDSFLCAGLDFKGQSQCAYQDHGGGLELSASFDPGRLFGIFSTELEVSAGATRSNKLLIIAQRGPNQIDSVNGTLELDYPITINCLNGARWEGKVAAELFVGVKVGFSVGTDEAAKTEKSWEADDSDDESEGDEGGDEGLKLESLSLGFEAEAKAGFAAEAGYSYDNFYAEDLCPLPFDSYGDSRQALGAILNEGDVKAIVCKTACDFINNHSVNFGNIDYHGYIWNATPTEITDKLKAGYKSVSSNKIKRQAKALIGFLSVWIDPKKKPHVPTSILISTHTGTGSAGLTASAGVSAKASAIVVSGEASAEVSAEALKIEGSYKSSNVRYQATYPAPHVTFDGTILEDSLVVMTQDTKITYKQIEFTPLTVKAEASVKTSFSKHGVEAEKELIEGITLLNRMTYTSFIVFWHSSNNTFKTAVKGKSTFDVNALSGTGISFGGSFEAENLTKFYESYDTYTKTWKSSADAIYFNSVAKSINITLDNLITFFNGFDNRYISDLIGANNVETVLLEASFAINSPTITLVRTGEGSKSSVGLSTDTAEKLSASARTLQAIRMRYRIQDTSNDDGDAFRLGFKFFGTGMGIALKKVDQAGSEGIADLATVWIDQSLVAIAGNSAYEIGVPPVALICQ